MLVVSLFAYGGALRVEVVSVFRGVFGRSRESLIVFTCSWRSRFENCGFVGSVGV
jgi:hypothetical protein